MPSLKNLTWRGPALLYGLLTIVIIVATALAQSQKYEVVKHTEAVVHPGYETYPETYYVQVAPAQAYSHTWDFWRILGIAFWLATGVYILAIANDLLGKNKGTVGSVLADGFYWVFALLLLFSVTFLFASYSNVYASNIHAFTAAEWNPIKDNPPAIRAVFEQYGFSR